MSSPMQGVKRGQPTEALASAKKSKQGTRVLSPSKLYRPRPEKSYKDLAQTVNGCSEATGREEYDPIVCPIARMGADAAVSASNRAPVSEDMLRRWLEKEMRAFVGRARAAKVEATKDMPDDWALHFRQIAGIGSPETKLYVVMSLLVTAGKDAIRSRCEAAQRTAAQDATACVDALVGIGTNWGEREPLGLFLGFLHALAAYRRPPNQSETIDCSFLDFMSPRERAGLEGALGKAKGKRSEMKARELISRIREFEEGRRANASNRNGENILTSGPGRASAPASDGFREQVRIAGAEKHSYRAQAPSRIPRKSISSSQIRTAHDRETFVPPKLISQPLPPAAHQFYVPQRTNVVPATSEVYRPRTSSYPALNSNSEHDHVRGMSQEQHRVVSTLPSAQQQSQSFAHDAGLLPPPAGNAVTGDGSGPSRDLHGQGEAVDRDHRAHGQMLPHPGDQSYHAAGFYQGADRHQANANQHSTGEVRAPQFLRRRFPDVGRVEARRFNGKYAPAESDGILKAIRGSASHSSLGVAFKNPEAYPPRTYLHEASTVFEIQPQQDVMHLFYDDGDPLDWGKMANKKHLEEIKERANIGYVHSVMALHALVRSKVEELQMSQRGENRPMPESFRITYPTRNAKSSQQRQHRLER